MTPSLGFDQLPVWLTELRETHLLIYLLNYFIIQALSERPDEELDRKEHGMLLRSGASVPIELRQSTFQHAEIYSLVQKLSEHHTLELFMEASSPV